MKLMPFWAPVQLLHQLLCWGVGTMAILLLYHRQKSKQMVKQNCDSWASRYIIVTIVQKLGMQQPLQASQIAHYLLTPALLLLALLVVVAVPMLSLLLLPLLQLLLVVPLLLLVAPLLLLVVPLLLLASPLLLLAVQPLLLVKGMELHLPAVVDRAQSTCWKARYDMQTSMHVVIP